MSEEDWWSRRLLGGEAFRGSLGNISEIFQRMEEIIEREFGELFKKAPRELVTERKLQDGTKIREWGPYVHGYSITIDQNGKPIVREFSNFKPTTRIGTPQVNIKEKREPLADALMTNGEVKVVVELPGVEKDDIKLNATENSLTISVDTPGRKYYKRMELPAKVVPKKAVTLYKNGVLEVTLQKAEEKKPKGEPIDV